MDQDFKEFIESLNKNNVQYLLVGGYAVAFHGTPRYTKDLDIWVNTTVENAGRVILALKEFGFESLGIKVEDLIIPQQIIQLGYPPLRIDLLTTIDGVIFEDCYPQRIIYDDSGTDIHLIDLASLIKNKRATGRSQDIADLEWLE
jgi:hypothetical protein